MSFISIGLKGIIYWGLFISCCLVNVNSGKMEFEKYIQMGKDCGLEGKGLIEFAQQREQLERKEREEHDRNVRDERQKEREHQREIKEFELSIAETTARQTSLEASVNNAQHTATKLPKLPFFRDGTDDMDAYILRFERFAEEAGWSETAWATSLGALLTGKALEVYSRMPNSQAKVYSNVKSALLFKYHLTADGFKGKFRNSRCESGETYMQFIERLKGYIIRWIELSNSRKTYDGLIDLLLQEQLLNSCSKDLAVFLKERALKDVSKMASLADTYTEAHVSYDRGRRKENVSDRSRSKGQGFQNQSYKPKGDDKNATPKLRDTRTCFICGKSGHIARDCWSKFKKPTERGAGLQTGNQTEKGDKGKDRGKDGNSTVACLIEQGKLCNCKRPNGYHVRLECGHELPIMSAACAPRDDVTDISRSNMPIRKGLIGDKLVEVLRDSGCSTVVVKKSLVRSDQFLGSTRNCVLLDGTVRTVPLAKIRISTPYFEGEVEALCMEQPLYDLILGNIEGCRDPNNPDQTWVPKYDHDTNSEQESNEFQTKTVTGLAVETRAQKVKKEQSLKPLRVTESETLEIGPREIKEAQHADLSISRLWKFTKEKSAKLSRTGCRTKFVEKDGLLYREFESPKLENGRVFNQLVVPEIYRQKVLKMSHDSIMSGHLRVKKTLDRLRDSFYWPGVQSDVKRYCISCDVCQRTVTKGSVTKVPLGTMPLIDTPFKRVAVDLVGPLQPLTDKGNRYILTLVDYATRYPEAVPLQRIETERVAEALIEIFSRVGVPEEILSDMGTQFTSDLMKEVGRLLSLKQMNTSPYHPMCNGLVEKFNGTLKRMLRRMCSERPSDWDRYLPALLFAYREAPQESLGFSPFELLYGRTVRGPLCILKELWTGTNINDEVKTTYQYIVDLRERLDSTCKIAQEELAKSSKRYRRYYNARAKERKFKVNDDVLLLLPTEHNKLTMQWKGPFRIVGKVAQNDYKIDIRGNGKTFHANLLK